MRKATERQGGHGGVSPKMGPAWFRANAGSVKAVELDVANECFDYIMNTRSTYKKLGETVGFFERLMKRERATLKQALYMDRGHSMPHGFSLIGLRRWYRLLSDTIGDARKDYKKNFSEEMKDGGPGWIESVDMRLVLLFAIKYRDRWAT